MIVWFTNITRKAYVIILLIFVGFSVGLSSQDLISRIGGYLNLRSLKWDPEIRKKVEPANLLRVVFRLFPLAFCLPQLLIKNRRSSQPPTFESKLRIAQQVEPAKREHVHAFRPAPVFPVEFRGALW